MSEDINRFLSWCKANNMISPVIEDRIFHIGYDIFYIKIYSTKQLDDDLCLTLDESEVENILTNKVNYIVFEFGKRFYYTELDEFKDDYNDVKYKSNFNDYKYKGELDDELSGKFNFVHLGIHSEYELLNGSHNSELWCQKGSFLKQKSLGICDKNTLAGVLSHQINCEKNNIKSIIGMTAVIAYDYDEKKSNQTLYECKLFAKDYKGWQNLLKINSLINSKYSKFIPENELFELSESLIFIFSSESKLRKISIESGLEYIFQVSQYFDDYYFQIDTVEFYDNKADLKYLNYIDTYLNNYMEFVEPILINDSYYVDEEMYQLKEYLNKTDKVVYDYSEKQFFKTITQSYAILSPLFKDNNKFNNLFNTMCDNTLELSKNCNFRIETGNHKLPKYEFLNGKTNEELFFDIIEVGISKKISKKTNIDEYYSRIQKECSVIVGAGFIDYFLILWDIVKWAKESNIYVGPGRGSVGGSLVAYLMDIIEVDPVENDLLFERFMNEARVSGERAKAADALPDIDLDFEASKRDEVKEYIKNRFGELYTCSIGTYTRLKIKSGLKDFARVKGITFNKANYISSLIDDQLKYEWKDLFKYATTQQDLKKFIQEYPNVIHLIKYSLNQCRSASIHASAVIILPKKKDGEDVNIYNWLPTRLIDGKLVSEWEGKYTDKAGFLKEDILGLSQLDKFDTMIALIRRNYHKKINLNKISFDDKEVYKLFHRGRTEDVFQFGSPGLKSYAKLAKPDNIEDITAMSALYRPGPMSSNAHTDFAQIKAGKKKPQYDYKLKIVTEKTYGLYVYQEQIMQAVVVLGGFTLVESDILRTQIKKFDVDGMKKSEDKFIKGAIKNGCERKEANEIWKKLLAFSGYGFNRSHAFAYSVITYQSQWMKVHYPLEFWTTSLQFSDDKEISKRISEMKKLKQGITLKQPNINNSGKDFDCNTDTMNIYWSLTKIKFVGSAAVDEIIAKRKNGLFGSYDDFITRVDKSKVNKRIVTNMIIAGAFDEIENIYNVEDRLPLLIYHLGRYNEELPNDYDEDLIFKSYFWSMKQREVCGYGEVDYRLYLKNMNNRISKKMSEMYVNADKFFEEKDYSEVSVCGRVVDVRERKSKHGEFLVMMILCNDDIIYANCWNDFYTEHSEELVDIKGKTISLSGKIKYDTFRGQNILNTTDKSMLLEL